MSGPRASFVPFLALAVLCVAWQPAQADTASCKLVRIVDWPVHMMRNHILVDGAINGKKVAIALDTGAQFSMIVRTAAKRLELPTRDAQGVRFFGVGGAFTTQIATIDEFKLGDAAARGLQLYVGGEGDAERGFDVLLGEDFLHRFDVEFDLPHHAVRLFQPRDCDGVSLAYWTKDTVGEVDIDPFRDAQPSIAFPVRINDRRIDAILDSGADYSVLSKQDAAAVGVAPGREGVIAGPTSGGLGANPVPTWIGAFESFAIGTERIRDVHIMFSDLYKDQAYAVTGSNLGRKAMPTQPMLLGADFLRAHRTFVSHSQRRLYFAYMGGPLFEAPAAAPPTAPRGAGGTGN